MASLVDNMAAEWVASTSYSVGNHVMHDNKLYECIQDTSSATFVESEWKLAYLVDFMTGKGNSNLAPTQATNFNNCTVGSLSVDNNRIYIFLANNYQEGNLTSGGTILSHGYNLYNSRYAICEIVKTTSETIQIQIDCAYSKLS